MQKNYNLATTAKADIKEIISYIADENPLAAEKLKSDIFAAFQKLSENPNIGQQRDDLTKKNVRFWPVSKNYMIIYSAKLNSVDILRIYNSAREISGII